MGDQVPLSEAIRVIEGLIVGDVDRGLPDPGLGVTLGTGLFLGRPLTTSQFLRDKEVVVRRTTSTNAKEGRDRTVAMVDDIIIVDLSGRLTSDTGDQRDLRDATYDLELKIRGRVMDLGETEGRGLQVDYESTTERGALQDGPAGYGSFEFIVLSSTYRLKRVESLTGGSP
jgi:hypothetical protein